MDGLRAYYGGQVALVTGGASGIGAELGKARSELGCKVILADIQGDVVKQVANEIGSRGGQAQPLVPGFLTGLAYRNMEAMLSPHSPEP